MRPDSNILQDWEFWLSLITAAAAVIALLLTRRQIKTSNRQHLFDKRLENYIVISGLFQLCQNTLHLFSFENKPIMDIEFEFGQLTNNSYLEGISDAIDNPLKEPYHKEFLKKIEDLKIVSMQANLLYKGKIAGLLSRFVDCYQEVLFSMYCYSVLFTKIREATQQWEWTLEEASEKLDEAKQRGRLFSTIANLRKVYEELQEMDIDKAIKKQIRLK